MFCEGKVCIEKGALPCDIADVFAVEQDFQRLFHTPNIDISSWALGKVSPMYRVGGPEFPVTKNIGFPSLRYKRLVNKLCYHLLAKWEIYSGSQLYNGTKYKKIIYKAYQNHMGTWNALFTWMAEPSWLKYRSIGGDSSSLIQSLLLSYVCLSNDFGGLTWLLHYTHIICIEMAALQCGILNVSEGELAC